jgi:hypothetical protein
VRDVIAERYEELAEDRAETERADTHLPRRLFAAGTTTKKPMALLEAGVVDPFAGYDPLGKATTADTLRPDADPTLGVHLLLTNDGDLSKFLSHPSARVKHRCLGH